MGIKEDTTDSKRTRSASPTTPRAQSRSRNLTPKTMRDTDSQLAHEARILCRYLIGALPRDKEVRLYREAVDKLQMRLEGAQDQRLWQFILRYPRTIALFDAGLALVEPESLIRRKILVMLAILEASPAYSRQFLPTCLKVRDFVSLGIRMLCSGLKSVVGYVLIKSFRILWR